MVKTVMVFIDIVSVALMSYGAWLHYPPLGFLLAGALLWFEVNQHVFTSIRIGNKGS